MEDEDALSIIIVNESKERGGSTSPEGINYCIDVVTF